MSWSGGKDSALALGELRKGSGPAPRALITTVTADYGRISMHGVRRELLSRQARAAGLPLVEVEIPAACSNDVYEQPMGQALAEAPLAEAQTIAFGDLFLADIRAYREERLSRVGKEAIFPLWGRDTSALAREFIAAGFEAVLVCVDPRRLDPSFAGRRFDAELLADLPPDVDPVRRERRVPYVRPRRSYLQRADRLPGRGDRGPRRVRVLRRAGSRRIALACCPL